MRLVYIFLLLFCSMGALFAHPMPNSVVLLNVHNNHYTGQVQLPLAELQSAIGMGVNDNSDKLIERLGDTLKIYLTKHIRPKSLEGKPWNIAIGKMKVIKSQNPLSGTYKELVIDFEMSPPTNYDLRNFYFDYDVILHHVASHQVLVVVKQDWQRGIVAEDTTTQQVGTIGWDVPSGTLRPLQISLEAGSTWIGFKKMCSLGIKHISEGTDHLLFILVLLLAPLTAQRNVHNEASLWGIRNLGRRLFFIITAFTAGHSLTLLIGSLGWVRPPSQIIEILIAVSILISAIHALKPLFIGREVWIAAGFGLIHGLAFANTLIDLHLSPKYMFLSILGFNLGIELMQLLIIILTVPWLALLSRTAYYPVFRVIAAIGVSVAAIGWLYERISEQPNAITILTEHIATQAYWLLLALAVLSVWAYFRNKIFDY